jgi:hypothetical protein
MRVRHDFSVLPRCSMIPGLLVAAAMHMRQVRVRISWLSFTGVAQP